MAQRNAENPSDSENNLSPLKKLAAGATALFLITLTGCYPSSSGAEDERPNPTISAAETPGHKENTTTQPPETTAPSQTPTTAETSSHSVEVNPFDDTEFRRLDSLSLEEFLAEPRDSREHYLWYFENKFEHPLWKNYVYNLGTNVRDHNPTVRLATPEDTNEEIVLSFLHGVLSAGASESPDTDPEDYTSVRDLEVGRKLIGALMPDQDLDEYSSIYLLLTQLFENGPGSGEQYPSFDNIEVKNKTNAENRPLEDSDGTMYEHSRTVAFIATPEQGPGRYPWSMQLNMGFVPADEGSNAPAHWRVMERLSLAYGEDPIF